MPVPHILIGLAAAAGTYGVGQNIHSHIRGKKTKEILQKAQELYDASYNRLEEQRVKTLGELSSFGDQKLRIWSDDLGQYVKLFKRFKKLELKGSVNSNERLSIAVQQLDLKTVTKGTLTAKEIAKGGVAVFGAGAIAGVATYGGAILLGHASTGAAISALHGVAAKNAALAFLGGGAKAAGGLGVAGGTAVIAGVVIGPVLAVQGTILAAKAKERQAKAEEAYSETEIAVEKMKTIGEMLKKVSVISGDYSQFLQEFIGEYRKMVSNVINIYDRAVIEQKTGFWNSLKDFFHIKFKLDFGKLSTTDQRYLQYSWLMTQILYQLLTTSLMTEDGNLQNDAESSLLEAQKAATSLLNQEPT